MANMTIDSMEVRNTLKGILQSIKGQGKSQELNRQVKSLFQNLTQKKKEVGVRAYHHSRFAFLKQGSYFTTDPAKNAFIDKDTLQFLYDKIKTIFVEIEKEIYKNGIDENLDYAIYYRDSEGRIKRASAKTIPKEQLRRTSKGTLKTTRLQTYLRQIQEQQQTDIKILDVHQHLGSFIGVIQATYKGGTIPNRVLSYGRLTEAFERHLQSNLNHNWNDAPPWNYNQIWSWLRESTSNVPWYLTGDVDGTQVKYIGSGDTRLSTGATFQDILNFFDYILQNDIDEEMINNAYKIFIQQLENASDNEIKELATMDLTEALQSSIGNQIY